MLPRGPRRLAAPGMLRSSVLVTLGVLHYGLWSLQGRDPDLISMLVFPVAAFGWEPAWLGAGRVNSAGSGWPMASARWLMSGWFWSWSGCVFQFILEIWRQHRDLSIAVPWGQHGVMNVRSVEQNASFAVAWMFPGLWLLLRKGQSRLAQLMVAGTSRSAGCLLHAGLGFWLVSFLPLAWAFPGAALAPRPSS